VRFEIPYHPTAKQRLFHESDADEILYGGSAGGGKLASVETPIPTPTGWTTMGEIQRGDEVFDENGEICVATWVSDVQYDKTYRLTFSDGTEIIAGASHQWVTETYADRTLQRNRTPEHRAARRAKRPARGTGKRPDLAKRNSTQQYEYKDAPVPASKTTQEIVDTLYIGKRLNHSIPVCKPINTPEKQLVIPPYVLGAWLGDGAARSGQITGIDEEVFAEIKRAGYTVTQHAAAKSRGILKIVSQLKKVGVYVNKHIPQEYLRASIDQRKELLMGLMDTDGYCDKRGQCEFTNTNKRLIDGVHELICSLGIKATIRTGRATLYGKDCGEKYDIKFQCDFPVFKLTRKLERQKLSGFRGTHTRRYIVSAEEIEPCPMKCIAVSSKSRLYLMGESFITTHNSCAVVIDALLKGLEHPGAFIYCFRRTYTELEDTLISEMKRWYPREMGRYSEGDHTYYLPNKAEIRFRHCQYESDLQKYQSAQISFLYIDEITHFTFPMFDFLSTRVRSPKELGFKPQVKLTGNPGGVGHGWVKATFIAGATPNEIKRVGIWSDYLQKEFVSSIQFIPAFLSDNPHLGEDYVRKLEGRSENLKRAMLYGDWDIFEGQAFMEWRNDFRHYDDHKLTHVINPFPIPNHWRIFRSYDFGHSAPYSVLWWAIGDETVNRRIYLIKELYGADPKDFNKGIREEAVEQARKIWQTETTPFTLRFTDTEGIAQEVEINMSAHGFIDGIADPSIWDLSAGMNICIGEMMGAKPYKIAFRDARWDQEARRNVVNNRLQGKQIFHSLLRFQDDDKPLIQVFNTCPNYIKHIPELVMDPNNPEDVVSAKVEDHDYDATRYMLMIQKPIGAKPKDPWHKRELPENDPLDQAPPLLKTYGRG